MHEIFSEVKLNSWHSTFRDRHHYLVTCCGISGSQMTKDIIRLSTPQSRTSFPFSRFIIVFKKKSSTTVSTISAGIDYPSGAYELTPDVYSYSFSQSLVFRVTCCRSLFVLLLFICWKLCCLSFDLHLLILVSSNC